jgi:hypothetical protein
MIAPWIIEKIIEKETKEEQEQPSLYYIEEETELENDPPTKERNSNGDYISFNL